MQDPEVAGSVATMLLAAGGRKTFLRQISAEVLLEMIGAALLLEAASCELQGLQSSRAQSAATCSSYA